MYFDPERHSEFQRIRHGYIDKPQGELVPDQDDLDLFNLYTTSSREPDDANDLLESDSISEHSTHSGAPVQETRTSVDAEWHNDHHEHQLRNTEIEPVSPREKAGDPADDDTNDIPWQRTVYTDSKNLWRSHMIRVQAMSKEEIEAKNTLLTRMNRDLLSELDSRDQVVIQSGSYIHQLTAKMRRLQIQYNKSQAESDYLYQVADDLHHRLNDSETQRVQLLQAQSSASAIPSSNDQQHDENLREIIEQQRDRILQLQFDTGDREEEANDLADFLEMAVKSQNDLSFELNELMLRGPIDDTAGSVPPQKSQDFGDLAITTSPTRQDSNEAEVIQPAIPMQISLPYSDVDDHSIEQDTAEFRRMINRMHRHERSPALVDQGTQVKQRKLAYPPANIGSYAQRCTFVIVGTFVNIEPSVNVPPSPRQELLEAADLLIRQSFEHRGHVLTPTGVPDLLSLEGHPFEDIDKALQDYQQRIRTTHEELQWALRRNQYPIVDVTHGQEDSESPPSYIRPTMSSPVDIRAIDQNIRTGNMTEFDDLSHRRRSIPRRRSAPPVFLERSTACLLNTIPALSSPFETPLRERTDYVPEHNHRVDEVNVEAHSSNSDQLSNTFDTPTSLVAQREEEEGSVQPHDADQFPRYGAVFVESPGQMSNISDLAADSLERSELLSQGGIPLGLEPAPRRANTDRQSLLSSSSKAASNHGDLKRRITSVSSVPSPLRMVTSHSDSTPTTPSLTDSSRSTTSSSGLSVVSPPTLNTRSRFAIATDLDLASSLRAKQDKYKQVYDSVDRDSINAPHQSQLMRDIQSFVTDGPSSPDERERRSTMVDRLQALSLLEGAAKDDGVSSLSVPRDHMTRSAQEKSDQVSSFRYGQSIVEVDSTLGGLKNPRHERPSPPRLPQAEETNDPDSQPTNSTGSEGQRSDVSTPDASSQSTRSSDEVSPGVAAKSGYLYLRIDQHEVAIPLSLPEMWFTARSKLPSYHLWYLCIPYLLVLSYLYYAAWSSREEWHEQNRAQIRIDIVERRNYSWRVGGRSMVAWLIETIFDRIYQPLPPGSYA